MLSGAWSTRNHRPVFGVNRTLEHGLVATMPETVLDVGLRDCGDSVRCGIRTAEPVGNLRIILAGRISVRKQVPFDSEIFCNLDQRLRSTLSELDAADPCEIKIMTEQARKLGQHRELGLALDQQPAASEEQSTAFRSDVVHHLLQFPRIEGRLVHSEDLNLAGPPRQSPDRHEGYGGEQLARVGCDDLLAG